MIRFFRNAEMGSVIVLDSDYPTHPVGFDSSLSGLDGLNKQGLLNWWHAGATRGATVKSYLTYFEAVDLSSDEYVEVTE